MKFLFASLLAVALAQTEINFNFAGILGGISGLPPSPTSPTTSPTPTPQSPTAAPQIQTPAPAPLPWNLNDTMLATECNVLNTYLSHAQLKASLALIIAKAKNCTNATCTDANGGISNNPDMWAAVVSRNGFVCNVAFSGARKNNAMPMGRVAAAQRANSANAFSLSGYAMSSANLYEATQPGGSLYGAEQSNPLNVALAYRGNITHWGTPTDPMVGGQIGGVTGLGGGLGLYELHGDHTHFIGAIGVAGENPCTDHVIAWRLRAAAGLDYVQRGVLGSTWGDNMSPLGTNGYGHPKCPGNGYDIAVNWRTIPAIHVIPAP